MTYTRRSIASAYAVASVIAACGSTPSADDIRNTHKAEFLHAETVLKTTMDLVNAAAAPAVGAPCTRGAATLTVAKAKVEGSDPAIHGNTEIIRLLDLTTKFVGPPAVDPSNTMGFRSGGSLGPLWITFAYTPRAALVPAIKSGKEITNLLVFKGVEPARVEVFFLEVAPLKLVCSFAVEGQTPGDVVDLDTVRTVNGKEVYGTTGAKYTAMVENTLVRLDEELETRFGVKRINRAAGPVVAPKALSPDAVKWSARFGDMYKARDQEVPECTAKPTTMVGVRLVTLGRATDPNWAPPATLKGFDTMEMMPSTINYMSASHFASLDASTGIVVVEPRSYEAPGGSGDTWTPAKLLGRTLVFDNQGKLVCRKSWELATPADMKFYVSGGAITAASADATARKNLASQLTSFKPFK